jgi:hypothetical protein
VYGRDDEEQGASRGRLVRRSRSRIEVESQVGISCGLTQLSVMTREVQRISKGLCEMVSRVLAL